MTRHTPSQELLWARRQRRKERKLTARAARLANLEPLEPYQRPRQSQKAVRDALEAILEGQLTIADAHPLTTVPEPECHPLDKESGPLPISEGPLPEVEEEE
jgi:hypothetical protein